MRKTSSSKVKVRTSLYLRKETLKGLQILAVKYGLSVSEIVDTVMQSYLESENIPRELKEWVG